MDANRLFTDREYKQVMYEYHSFVAYILGDINHYTIHSSSVRITERSVIYKHKDTFMKMLQEAFPEFVVTFEKSGYDLDEGEMSITVDWEEFGKRT